MSAPLIAALAKHHGVPVTEPVSGHTVQAFVYPMRYKSRMYLEETHTPLGSSTNAKYLYIGPPDLDLTALAQTDVLQTQGSEFYCLVAEPVYFNGRVLYYRGILKKKQEETDYDDDANGAGSL